MGLVFIFYNSFRQIYKKKIYLKKREIAWENLRENIENKVEKFRGKVGILIKDLETDWEISFNKEEPFPAASLIKVPIMVACFQAVREGKLKLEDKVKLKASDKVSGSGILKNLPSGKTFTMERLIELMITVSDNTATNILIEKLGFDYLNNSFKKMGLKDTKLLRKMMDFRYRKRGIDNFTTAYDVAYILERIYHKKLLDKDFSQKCLDLLFAQKFRDRIPSKLPKEVKVAHKTGLEKKVCHDAGIVFGNKGNYIIVVLTKGGETKLAKDFISEISLLVYNYYSYF